MLKVTAMLLIVMAAALLVLHHVPLLIGLFVMIFAVIAGMFFVIEDEV